MTALVMLSGGADSVWALRHALINHEGSVAALHISLEGSGVHRESAELRACEEVVGWLRGNCRDFEFDSLRLDMGRWHTKLNSLLFPTIASEVILQRGDVTDIFWGECSEEQHGILHPGGWTVMVPIFEAIFNNSDIWKAAREGIYPTIPRMPKMHRPGIELSKREQMLEMEPELRELTWSCPFPQEKAPGVLTTCGRCAKCAAREGFDNEKELRYEALLPRD